mgnify:CR=1 FL=1
MKPKTKIQKEVARLSANLRPTISDTNRLGIPPLR